MTIAGVKLGQRFLAVGVHDPKLVAALGVKAGLTGRTCVIDADEARLAKGADDITKEGALVEPIHAPLGMWPLDAESFDVALVAHLLPGLDAEMRARCVMEVLRVLRPGGRVVVIERAQRGGLGRILGGSRAAPAGTESAGPPYSGPVDTLRENGFAVVRLIAETDGVSYVEGIKRG